MEEPIKDTDWEMYKCDRCLKNEGVCVDYRPRLELLESGTVFRYDTPLNHYEKFIVCFECFRVEDDKKFWRGVQKEA